MAQGAIVRQPVYRVTCDDFSDPAYPLAVTPAGLIEAGDTETFAALYDAAPLHVGDSITVGGGAAVQFTLTRIR